MFCKKCGTKVDDDSVYCYKCGTKLFNSDSFDNSDMPNSSEEFCCKAEKADSYSDESSHSTDICNKHIALTNPESVILGRFKSEPLEWVVLDVKPGKSLIICKNIVAFSPYSKEPVGFSWSRSIVLKWLNGDFYENAFNLKERLSIIFDDYPVDTVNPVFASELHERAKTKIFIFGVEEYNKYLKGNNLERATLIDDRRAESEWWLCTPGVSDEYMAVINGSGELNPFGAPVGSKATGIRPAMWIKT